MFEFVHVCPQMKVSAPWKLDLRSLLAIMWVCSATRMGYPSPLFSLHNNWEVSSSKRVWLLGFPSEGSLPGRSHDEANAKHAAVSRLCQLE